MYNSIQDEPSKFGYRKGDWKMEVLKAMTAREVLNLIEWLKAKNFTNDDIVDCSIKKERERRKRGIRERERDLSPLFLFS